MDKDYSSKVKSLRNLALFKNKTDEEIIEFLKAREAKQQQHLDQNDEEDAPEEETPPSILTADFEKRYREKLRSLQKEYNVDMNDSNDAEMLKSLARHIIQVEIVHSQILRLQQSKDVDTRTLLNLGQFQKGANTTMLELQEKLGIGRKQRKDKQVDSIPQFIDLVRTRARDVWERTTVPVRCENCQIELARYWLNFPINTHLVHFEVQCEKCKEMVVLKR